jgi:putrescine transport system substrate-binding protein
MRRAGFTMGGLALFAFLTGCNKPVSGTSAAQPSANADDDKVVNLYTWADYIAPDVLATFEKTTGVKVRVALIETNGTLETRMLTGHSGYDLVVPTAQDFPRQIRSGAYLPLDKSKLPNLKNLVSFPSRCPTFP